MVEPGDFRKLNLLLPRQPLVNQRPWWIAGLLFATLIVMLAVWSYNYSQKKKLAIPKTNEGVRTR